MAVTLENAVFCDVTSYGSCKNRRFGGTYRLLHQVENKRVEVIIFLRSVLQLLGTANVVPNSLILFVLMTEAKRSSETSVFQKPRCVTSENAAISSTNYSL
jgi:hypothetical protein